MRVGHTRSGVPRRPPLPTWSSPRPTHSTIKLRYSLRATYIRRVTARSSQNRPRALDTSWVARVPVAAVDGLTASPARPRAGGMTPVTVGCCTVNGMGSTRRDTTGKGPAAASSAASAAARHMGDGAKSQQVAWVLIVEHRCPPKDNETRQTTNVSLRGASRLPAAVGWSLRPAGALQSFCIRSVRWKGPWAGLWAPGAGECSGPLAPLAVCAFVVMVGV